MSFGKAFRKGISSTAGMAGAAVGASSTVAGAVKKSSKKSSKQAALLAAANADNAARLAKRGGSDVAADAADVAADAADAAATSTKKLGPKAAEKLKNLGIANPKVMKRGAALVVVGVTGAVIIIQNKENTDESRRRCKDCCKQNTDLETVAECYNSSVKADGEDDRLEEFDTDDRIAYKCETDGACTLAECEKMCDAKFVSIEEMGEDVMDNLKELVESAVDAAGDVAGGVVDAAKCLLLAPEEDDLEWWWIGHHYLILRPMTCGLCQLDENCHYKIGITIAMIVLVFIVAVVMKIKGLVSSFTK